MNKLIRDIAIQTDAWCDQNGSVKASEWEEKFAELIVRECAAVAYSYDPLEEAPSAIAKLIEVHFGVKE